MQHIQKKPPLSVVIPTKNAGAGFRESLEMIFQQELPYSFEVIVVDSGSEDETLDICRDYPVNILQIPAEEFNHGRTRNYAISRSRGEFIVLVVQDAVPANSRWMGSLVAALESDSRAAGAYSRHLASPEADFLVRRNTEYWHSQQGRRVVQRIEDPEAFAQMNVAQKMSLCRFDNVSSAIRRSVWESCPFPPIAFAEDLAWALQVLRLGHHLIYEPESMVYHSHDRGFLYDLRRMYIDTKAVLGILGPFPQNSQASLRLSQMITVIVDLLRAASHEGCLSPRLVLHIVSFGLATTLGTRLGSWAYLTNLRRPNKPILSSIDAYLTRDI